MDAVMSLLETTIGNIGGEPGSKTWEVITAILGWIFGLLIIATFTLPWFDVSPAVMTTVHGLLFPFMVIVMSREIKRVRAGVRKH